MHTIISHCICRGRPGGGGVLTCELDAEHDHARHPEEEDVMPSLQESPGVELGKVGGLVGPPHGGEGPQATAEPGVQHILILHRFTKHHKQCTEAT